MRAVFSFWSRPHRLFYHRVWHSERAHLLCWALAVSRAASVFEETVLVTDEAGADLLAGRLALPFGHVDTRLEALDREAADPEWWVMGKLTAYAAQDRPFAHLDADVILWKALAPRLLQAPLFAQNPEHFDFEDQSLYRPDNFMEAMETLGGWLPAPWLDYAGRRRNGAVCCGVLGANDTAFVRRYAGQALEIIRHPLNAPVWERIGIRDNILVEQYFLQACLEAPGAPQAVEYIFPSSTHAFDPDEAGGAGFTHLIGHAKADASIAARLEARVSSDHPRLYQRVLETAGG